MNEVWIDGEPYEVVDEVPIASLHHDTQVAHEELELLVRLGWDRSILKLETW